MDKLIIALFETSVALVLFYVVFAFWLKKETFFRENRFYLLLTAGFSLLIPWINFSLPSNISTTVMVYNLLDVVSVSANGYEKSLINTITAWQWIFVVYALGVAVALGLLIVNMVKVTRIDKISHQNFGNKVPNDVRFIEADVVPFSFFNKIYINPNNYTQNQLNDIIAHESVHLRQQHTYDCLFYELLIVFFWFNPIVYKYRASAKELHEFLADEGAIKSGIESIEYQKLLFEQATGLKALALANSFDYSLIKRRLIMITKIKSPKAAKVRLLLFTPVLLGLLMVFACKQNNIEIQNEKAVNSEESVFLDGNDSINRVYNKEKETVQIINDSKGKKIDERVYFIVENMPEFPGGEDAIRLFLAQNIKYPKQAIEKGITGMVYVSFIVNKKGYVKDVQLVKGVDKLLDNEALKVVASIPQWTPGENKGEKVNVSFTVPIKFALN